VSPGAPLASADLACGGDCEDRSRRSLSAVESEFVLSAFESELVLSAVESELVLPAVESELVFSVVDFDSVAGGFTSRC
jgi:hypothetical protein